LKAASLATAATLAGCSAEAEPTVIVIEEVVEEVPVRTPKPTAEEVEVVMETAIPTEPPQELTGPDLADM
jgi:hypothetical protein